MINALLVFLGGGIGAVIRFFVQTWLQWKPDLGFPWGTLTVNVFGAFMIGLLMTTFARYFELAPQWSLFLIIGVLGGLTTFSSLVWETYQLLTAANFYSATVYILGTGSGGALALVFGVWLGKILKS